MNNFTKNFWTQSRKELYEWMQKRNAAPLAELYEGALQLIYETHISGRIKFICHAIREISNRLPDIISGIPSTGTLQYTNRLDVISEKWRKNNLGVERAFASQAANLDSVISASPDIAISKDIFLSIDALIKEHEETRTKPEAKAWRLVEACVSEDQLNREAMQRVISQWIAINKWFMKKVHYDNRTDSETDERELISKFEIFETTLHSLIQIQKFFDRMNEIDEILEDTNL